MYKALVDTQRGSTSGFTRTVYPPRASIPPAPQPIKRRGMKPKANAGKDVAKNPPQNIAQQKAPATLASSVNPATIPMEEMQVDLRTKRAHEPPIDATIESSPTNPKLAPGLRTADSPKPRASKNLAGQLDASGVISISDSDDGIPLNERARSQVHSKPRADASEPHPAPAPTTSRTPATGKQSNTGGGATATRGVRLHHN